MALLALALLGNLAAAQDREKTVKAGDFETDAAGWAAMKLDAGGLAEDPGAKLGIAKDGARVGKGSLSFTYEIVPGTLRVVALQKELGLEGMKSIRFSVKCSASTALIVSLTERNGATYQSSVACPAGAWQDIAVNLDEFVADDPAKDGNGRLDPDELASVGVFDIAGFVAQLLPDLKGPRTLWLDEIVFCSKPVPATSGPAEVTKVVPVYRVDSFETQLVRWTPISIDFSEGPKIGLFEPPAAIDATAAPGGGRQSLKHTYPRGSTRIYGLMRNLEKVDLARATGLDLSLKTSLDGTYIVNLEEKDGSRYNQMVTLNSGDGWKALSFGFGSFTLADDSQDENGKLDASQIKQILVADASALAGGSQADRVTLWIDEVFFVLSSP
jgi:hypothetical protein